MNEALLEIAKVGGPVVLVVLLFLRFLTGERKAARTRDAAFLATLRNLNQQGSKRADECHKVHAKSIETIERNTAAYEKLSEAHESMQATLAALANRPAPPAHPPAQHPHHHHTHNN
jgi:hypothetical protein